MGIRVVRGRDLARSDRPGAEAALVSEAMARRYWPTEDPIGRRIILGSAAAGTEVMIVGVVGDVRYQSLETAEIRPMLYLSALARPPRTMQLVVRGDHAVERSASLRDLVVSFSPGQPAPTVSRMEDLVNRATATQRFILGLFIVFAASALALAVIGVYSVMSYVVRLRTHEMGIRLALGAPRDAVVRLIVASALRLALGGATLGLLGAWMLTRFLSTIVFGVGTRDPITFAAIAALIVFAAFLAALMPARRATRADPMLALRGS
jgi:hypothetical protein